MRIKFHKSVGLGDSLAMTAFVREFKRKHPDEAVRLESVKHPDVWKGNPSINWGNLDNDVSVQFNLFPADPPASFAHAFAAQLGFELMDDTPEVWLTAEERLIDVGVKSWERTVAVDTNAGWASRRWTKEGWLRTAELLKADGWTVLELSKRGPASAAGYQVLPGAVQLTAWNDIRSMAGILAQCSLYLGQDSGLFHLAAAVGTPQVVLFGSVPWYRRAYWNTTPVFDYAPCEAACINRPRCARSDFKNGVGKPRCMENIKPERVVEAVNVAAKRFVGSTR